MNKIVNNKFESISKKDSKRLERRIGRATGESPLQIFIGTCPDYSHDGEHYTFESVGSNVPLLTQQQMRVNQALFDRLELFWRSIHL